MRRAWGPFFLLLVLLLGAGCLDAAFQRAPVIRVEESYAFEGEGVARGGLFAPCDTARIGEDGSVTLARPGGEGMPSLLVVWSPGDSWRAHAQEAGPARTLGLVAGSGGFHLFPSHGVAFFGFSPLLAGTPIAYNVSFQEGVAYLEDQPIPLGGNVTQSVPFEAPTLDNGTLRGTLTVRASYLGKVPVDVQDAACVS